MLSRAVQSRSVRAVHSRATRSVHSRPVEQRPDNLMQKDEGDEAQWLVLFNFIRGSWINTRLSSFECVHAKTMYAHSIPAFSAGNTWEQHPIDSCKTLKPDAIFVENKTSLYYQTCS
jgi:hypothetical protein